MARWKGEKVSRKRLWDLKKSVEFRRVCQRDKYGFFYKRPSYVIGGNKNSKENNINVW